MAHWKRLCDLCWAALPGALRHEIVEARAAQAPHLVAGHVDEAVVWLAANPAALSRRIGERDG